MNQVTPLISYRGKTPSWQLLISSWTVVMHYRVPAPLNTQCKSDGKSSSAIWEEKLLIFCRQALPVEVPICYRKQVELKRLMRDELTDKYLRSRESLRSLDSSWSLCRRIMFFSNAIQWGLKVTISKFRRKPPSQW